MGRLGRPLIVKDWVAWHRDYEDPTSALSQRRREVTRLVGECLDRFEGGPVRVLSLCAGDAVDLADALHGRSSAALVSGAVVELDAALAARAVENLRATDASVDVLIADAGCTSCFADRLAVDLLLLVGVFGNVSDDDVERTIRAVPAMCAPGASVVWTRHRREPDLTPQIRQWFDEADCDDVAFASPGVGQFAIGVERLARPSVVPALPDQLFHFVH